MLTAKILICGLPGAGKTTLARALVAELSLNDIKATIVDGDSVRELTGNTDFSLQGRIKQAATVGSIANDLNEKGVTACCSFVCPTPETRQAFWGEPTDAQKMTVFVDRVIAGAYPDTNQMFIPPNLEFFDHIVGPDETVEQSVAAIVEKLGVYYFDYTKPTALLVGRFQPFHDGHKALVAKAIAEVGQCVIGLRDTPQDDDNPLEVSERMTRIDEALLPDFAGRYTVEVLPNVVKVVYGRAPGYEIEQYKLDDGLEAISGTKLREQGL